MDLEQDLEREQGQQLAVASGLELALDWDLGQELEPARAPRLRRTRRSVLKGEPRHEKNEIFYKNTSNYSLLAMAGIIYCSSIRVNISIGFKFKR
ncbi:MAG: hypothetical protein HY291_06375 [Planctomycetes bacterium]|nr:hypothetical protein [Planctomycetota bacterium]